MARQAKALFAPGVITCSPGVLAALKRAGVAGLDLLCRHLTGDWGDVDARQRGRNKWAAKNGRRRIVSRYPLPDAEVVVITIAVHNPRKRLTTFYLSSELLSQKRRILNGQEKTTT